MLKTLLLLHIVVETMIYYYYDVKDKEKINKFILLWIYSLLIKNDRKYIYNVKKIFLFQINKLSIHQITLKKHITILAFPLKY